jgi:hypothetical protein
MKELFIKFVVGGTVVSFFAVLGDLSSPRASPDFLERARLLLPHFLKDGKAYAHTEARSMIGAIAFFLRFVCESAARQA